MLYFTDKDDTGIKLLTQNTTPADIGALSGTIERLYRSATGLTTGGTATISNITGYKYILVYCSLYTSPIEQVSSVIIPVELITYLNGSSTSLHTDKSLMYVCCATIYTQNRRVRFGFPSNTQIKVGSSEGESGHLPRLIAVYGIK